MFWVRHKGIAIGRLLLAVIFILTVFQYLCNAKPKTMRKGTVRTMHELPLKNEDYWIDPQSKLSDFTWNVLQEGKEKVIIDCPDFVPMNIRHALPVVMVGARDVGVSYKDDFEGKTIGISINLETGHLYVGSVHRAPDIKSDITPSPGLIVQDFLIDLRKYLGIPFSIATYKTWFIYYDLISNGIICRLSNDEKSFGSEEEKKYLKEVILNSPRRDILINDALVYSIKSVDAMPKLGIDANIETAGDIKESVMQIKGRVPVLPHQKVRPEERVANLEGTIAVLPLDLIIIRTHGGREQLLLGVPCYTDIQNENGKEVGTFQVGIHLNKLLRTEMVKGEKLFVYVFSGEFAAGPGLLE